MGFAEEYQIKELQKENEDLKAKLVRLREALFRFSFLELSLKQQDDLLELLNKEKDNA